MQKLTKLSIVTSGLLVAFSQTALAQDDTPQMMPEVQVVDSFTAADIDADEALDRDEFISFVVMKSDEGDAEYKSIKISGEYDNHFNTKDYNADGLLTAQELKAPAEEAPIDEPG